jgi:hypothetical protein
MRLTHGVDAEPSRLLYLKFLNSLDGALALYSICNQQRLDQRPWYIVLVEAVQVGPKTPNIASIS